MSNDASRAWQFYIDDMIGFADKVIAYAVRNLLVRFPEVHDGYDRLGMVYEARSDNKQAADYYRKVIDFVRARPDQYEPGFEDTFHRLMTRVPYEVGCVTKSYCSPPRDRSRPNPVRSTLTSSARNAIA